MNRLIANLPTSIFAHMSMLAAEHQAINLGQGFPDFGWPEPILQRASRSLVEESNQYPPSRGLPRLREAIAAHYNRHQGLDVAAGHVCVTSGATEAVVAAILATVRPGDEVIILTPAYDCYAPMIRRAGGTVREVALQPPEWRIDRPALEAAVGPKTSAILFNNPHNPAGRLFDRAELEAIAAVAVGGTSLLGGRATIVGTVIGALIIQLLRFTLIAHNIPDGITRMVIAGAIVVAVLAQRQRSS